MSSPYGDSGIVLVILIGIALYLLPTIIAVLKNHPYKVAIFLTNLLGGLFGGVGWVVAIVWCFVVPKSSR